MHRILSAVLPLAGGVLVAVQAPLNARLRTSLGSPIAAGFVSFAVGAAVLFVLLAAVGGLDNLGRVGAGPW